MEEDIYPIYIAATIPIQFLQQIKTLVEHARAEFLYGNLLVNFLQFYKKVATEVNICH